MNRILNCKEYAKSIKDRLLTEISELSKSPRLAIIRIETKIENDDFANIRYMNNIKKACEYVGIKLQVIELPFNTKEEEVIKEIKMLNGNRKVNGIMVQYPVPKHMNPTRINETIAPIKDSDGLTSGNLGRIIIGDYFNLPCTPKGVMKLLLMEEITVKGKDVVIVGRSTIVGKPMVNLLINSGATVTVCNSNTKNLKLKTKKADIVICAIGKPKYFTPKYFKNGQVIIDIGTNMDENGKLCGDVDFKSVLNHLNDIVITPVPGGVGTLTTSMLLSNVLNSHKKMVKDFEDTTKRK